MAWVGVKIRVSIRCVRVGCKMGISRIKMGISRIKMGINRIKIPRV